MGDASEPKEASSSGRSETGRAKLWATEGEGGPMKGRPLQCRQPEVLLLRKKTVADLVIFHEGMALTSPAAGHERKHDSGIRDCVRKLFPPLW